MTTRERIIEFIRANPGSHFRKIQRELGISVGAAQYFVNDMERHGQIRSNRHKQFRQFWVKEKIRLAF